jgi:hypothetical protein
MVFISRGLQSGEEYGIADAMNVTRLNCRHAYCYQRVTVAFAYDKSRASARKRLLATNADSELLGIAIWVATSRVLKTGVKLAASWRHGSGPIRRFLSSPDGFLLMLKFPIRESDGNTSRMVLEKLIKGGENQRAGQCRKGTDSRTL